ncbi:MAG: hypothetical protein H7176_01450 [Bdellovibrionales bacterium]|nr:hypothetical protein [Massilia sp.]
MNTMKWLLRREFWEHKGSMFWAPIVVGALMVLFGTLTVAYSTAIGKVQNNLVQVTDNGVTTTTHTGISSAFNAMPAEKKQQLAETVASSYLAAGAPLFLILAAVIFFYCLGTLYDERRDRSILFWKSLPVSDTQTVVSKVVIAAVVAPLITIAVATLVSLLLLLIVGTAFAVSGVNLFSLVLSNSALYLAPFQLLGILPVYALWALPTIGWLLMVSAWAKSKVFLWAVGTPVIALIAVRWISYLLALPINMDWFIENVIARGLVGLFPGNWLILSRINPVQLSDDSHRLMMSKLLEHSWLSLLTPNAWIGAAAGVGMILVAIRLRRWRDEG